MGTFRILAFACFVATIPGCATGPTYPTNPAEQAAYYAEAASFEFRNGRPPFVFINAALAGPDGPDKIRALFAKEPAIAEAYKGYLRSEVATLTTSYWAINTKESIERATSVLPQVFTNEVMASLEHRVSAGNADGTLPFLLSDDFMRFESLRSADQQRTIVDNTIKAFQTNTINGRPITALVAYVAKVGASSPEGQRIGALLPTLRIRRSELPMVATVFPDFADAQTANMTIKIWLKVEPPDRLLREDLLVVLRRDLKGIDFVDAEDPKAVSLVVERLRFNESKLPDRTQTITYAQYEVNIAAAVLLMPRNASYLYDITTGGAEIEYGFAVKAAQSGRPIADELVRDRLTSTYATCTNARVQNVFGGVQRADFVANSDMVQRCSGNTAQVDLDKMRTQVYQRIAERVAKIAPIARVQELN
jgi:hypothetical protein